MNSTLPNATKKMINLMRKVADAEKVRNLKNPSFLEVKQAISKVNPLPVCICQNDNQTNPYSANIQNVITGKLP